MTGSYNVTVDATRAEDVSGEVGSPIQAELQRFILNAARDRDGASTILDDYVVNIGLCENLNEYVEARVVARYGAQIRWTPSSTWALVRSILERVDLDSAQKLPHLFAAKVLLGIGVDYRDDVAVPGRDGMTLAQLRASDRRLKNLRLEKHLDLRKAFVLKLFPRLTEYTALRPNRPATVQIGIHLAQAIWYELENDDLPQHVSTRTETSGSAQAFLKGLIARLENPPWSYYPLHLGSRRLSSSLRLEKRIEYVKSEARWEENPGFAEFALRSAGSPAGEVLSGERRVVVLGDTGSGKSTIAMAWLADSIDSGNVGVLVRAAELARRAADASPVTPEQAIQTLLASFEDWLGEPIAEQIRQWLASELPKPSSLIVLDAVDEIDDQVHIEAFRKIVSIIDAGSTKVLLTSRLAGYRQHLNNPEELVVLPLSHDSSLTVIEEWFSESNDVASKARAVQFLRDYRVVNGYRAVAGNPLILGLVAMVSSEERPPRLLGELFGRCLELFLARVWKPNIQRRGDDLAVGSALIALKEIAWKLASDGIIRSRATTNEILRATEDESVARVLIRTDGILLATSAANGIVHPNVSYKWLHTMFQEHLMGGYLADMYAADPDRATRGISACLSDRGSWQEVGAHALSLLDVAGQIALSSAVLHAKEMDPHDDPGSDPTLKILLRQGTLHDEARQALAAKFAADDRWEVAFLFDCSAAFDLMRADLRTSSRRIAALARFLSSSEHPLWNLPAPSELLKAYENRPNRASDWILPLLAHTDYSAALRLALRDQNPLRTAILRINGVDHTFSTPGPELHPAVAATIMDRMVAEPVFPVRFAHVQALQFSKNGHTLTRNRVKTDRIFALVGFVLWPGRVSDHWWPEQEVRAALRGRFGPRGELEVGAAFPGTLLRQQRTTEFALTAIATDLPPGRPVPKSNQEPESPIALAAAAITLTMQHLRRVERLEKGSIEHEPSDRENVALRQLGESIGNYDLRTAHTAIPLCESVAVAATYGSITDLGMILGLSLNSQTEEEAEIDTDANFDQLVGKLMKSSISLLLSRVDEQEAWRLGLSMLEDGEHLAPLPLHLVKLMHPSASMDDLGEMSMTDLDRSNDLVQWGEKHPHLVQALRRELSPLPN